MALKHWKLMVAALVCVVALAAGCEKNNDVVAQQQLQDSANACAKGCTDPVPGCQIKGNVNNRGVRFYHVPGTKSYDLVKVVPQEGDRWFCSEQQAKDNGFTRNDD